MRTKSRATVRSATDDLMAPNLLSPDAPISGCHFHESCVRGFIWQDKRQILNVGCPQASDRKCASSIRRIRQNPTGDELAHCGPVLAAIRPVYDRRRGLVMEGRRFLNRKRKGKEALFHDAQMHAGTC